MEATKAWTSSITHDTYSNWKIIFTYLGKPAPAGISKFYWQMSDTLILPLWFSSYVKPLQNYEVKMVVIMTCPQGVFYSKFFLGILL